MAAPMTTILPAGRYSCTTANNANVAILINVHVMMLQ